jgi:hypothetical protein
MSVPQRLNTVLGLLNDAYGDLWAFARIWGLGNQITDAHVFSVYNDMLRRYQQIIQLLPESDTLIPSPPTATEPVAPDQFHINQAKWIFAPFFMARQRHPDTDLINIIYNACKYFIQDYGRVTSLDHRVKAPSMSSITPFSPPDTDTMLVCFARVLKWRSVSYGKITKYYKEYEAAIPVPVSRVLIFISIAFFQLTHWQPTSRLNEYSNP